MGEHPTFKDDSEHRFGFADATADIAGEREKPLYGLKDGAPVRKELQEVFDPLSALAAQRIEFDMVVNPAEVREVLDDSQISLLSYSELHRILPPDLFGDAGPNVPLGPEDSASEAAAAFARDYIMRKRAEGTPAEQRFYANDNPLPPEFSIADEQVEWLGKRGVVQTILEDYKGQGIEAEIKEIQQFLNGDDNGSTYA